MLLYKQCLYTGIRSLILSFPLFTLDIIIGPARAKPYSQPMARYNIIIIMPMLEIKACIGITPLLYDNNYFFYSYTVTDPNSTSGALQRFGSVTGLLVMILMLTLML